MRQNALICALSAHLLAGVHGLPFSTSLTSDTLTVRVRVVLEFAFIRVLRVEGLVLHYHGMLHHVLAGKTAAQIRDGHFAGSGLARCH